MTYELAQRLKELNIGHSRPEGNITIYRDENGVAQRFSGWYIPNLDVLIELCGNRINTLQRLTTKGWRAFAEDWTKDTGFYDGETPDEAVAKLLIALNNDK